MSISNDGKIQKKVIFMNLDPILTQEEAEHLLAMIKQTLVDNITFPEKGDKLEFNAKSVSTKDLFSIIIFRGKINPYKYSYNIRVTKNGAILLGLDINNTGKHRNPDGSIICGSHWHIYSKDHGRQYAIPAEDIDSADFIKNTMLFFQKINLLYPPLVTYQTELIL